VAQTAADRAHAEALDAADPLAAFRERFALGEEGRIYADANSLGPPPFAVVEALAAQVEEWGRRLVTGWPDWIGLPRRVGDLLAESVLGAERGEVLMADSTTVNLYKLAAATLDLVPDRRAVVVDPGDFPTDRYVLQGLAAARGLELRLLEADPVEGPRPDDVERACRDGEVGLAVVSHVNYRSGALADLAAVTEAARAHGTLVLWDLSHSAGAVPVELARDGADLAVGCTYKYLCAGPGSVAFLYVRRALEEKLRSPIWGWFGQRDQFAMGPAYEPVAGVERFLAGTPPVLELAAAEAAVRVLAEAGIGAVRTKSAALTALAVELHDLWLAELGFALGTPRDPGRRGGHVAVRHPEALRICRALVERERVIPDFRAPDSIRLGFAPLATRFVDVWDAFDRLRRLVASGGHEGVDVAGLRVT
jgi:kynureninase